MDDGVEPVTIYCRTTVERTCSGCPVCCPPFEAWATIEPAPWNRPAPAQPRPFDADPVEYP